MRLTPRLPPKLDKVLSGRLLLFRSYSPSMRTITVGVTPTRKPAPASRAPLPPQIGSVALAALGQLPPYLVEPAPALR